MVEDGRGKRRAGICVPTPRPPQPSMALMKPLCALTENTREVHVLQVPHLTAELRGEAAGMDGGRWQVREGCAAPHQGRVGRGTARRPS